MLEFFQHFVFLDDRATKNGIDQSARRARYVYGLVHRRVVWDSHLVELVNSEAQDLAGREVQSAAAKMLNDKVEVRTVADHTVKGFCDKRSIHPVESGVLQRIVQDVIGKFASRFPTLQRLERT